MRGRKPRVVKDDVLAWLRPRWEAVEVFGELPLMSPKELRTLKPGDLIHTEKRCWVELSASMLTAFKDAYDVDLLNELVTEVQDRIVDREYKAFEAGRRSTKAPDDPHEKRLREWARQACCQFFFDRKEPFPSWLLSRAWKKNPEAAHTLFQRLADQETPGFPVRARDVNCSKCGKFLRSRPYLRREDCSFLPERE